MKKSMFILSVVMVVVMAIALTTSSLAWYTADSVGNKDVTANGISVRAAKFEMEGNLVISTESAQGFTNGINFSDAAGTNYLPTMPVLATNDLSTLGSSLKASTTGVFKSAEYVVIDNVETFVSSDKIKAGSVMTKDFYLAAAGSATEVNFTLSAEFTGTKTADSSTVVLADQSYVVWCVIVEDATGNIVLAANTKSNTQKMSYGIDGSVADTAITTAVKSDNATVVPPSALAAVAEDNTYGASSKYTVYMWYDGDTLYNTNSADASGVTISVEITATQA